MARDAEGLSVLEAMEGRRSIRRFLPDPVPEETVRAILAATSWAPSGSNTQPWLVHVVTGAARERASAAALASARSGAGAMEYPYYPDRWFEPYLSRRRAVGYGLYGILGLTREDKTGMAAQHERNFLFFDAPVGLFFSMDARFERGSWLDMGMFIQNVMLAARGFGLETCPQAAWVFHGPAMHAALDLPDDHVLLCGMSLGYADPSAPENALRSERAPVDAFTTFLRD